MRWSYHTQKNTETSSVKRTVLTFTHKKLIIMVFRVLNSPSWSNYTMENTWVTVFLKIKISSHKSTPESDLLISPQKRKQASSKKKRSDLKPREEKTLEGSHYLTRLKVHTAPHPSGFYQGRISLIQQLPPFTFNLSTLLCPIALVIHRRTGNHAIWQGN